MLALATNATLFTPARVFNHDIMGCTADDVTGNHLYSGRVLGMTEPGDVIQLHPDLRPEWPFSRAHYQRVGLSYTDQVVWHVDHRGLTEHPDHDASAFYFGAGEQRARPDDDCLDDWRRVTRQVVPNSRLASMRTTGACIGLPTSAQPTQNS